MRYWSLILLALVARAVGCRAGRRDRPCIGI